MTLLLLIAGGIVLPCAAQEQEMVRVQFVSFPLITSEKPIELLTGDGKAIPVEMPSNALSETYTIAKPRQWALGESGVDKEGNPIFKPFGKADMLASPMQIILVTRKGATNADGLNMYPFSMSDDGLGQGKYLFFNASEVDIACKLGDANFAIKPNRFILVQPKPSAEKNDRKYIYAYFFYRRGNDAKAFYESTWRYNEKARCMVFIHHDPNTKQLRTHTIRSFRM